MFRMECSMRDFCRWYSGQPRELATKTGMNCKFEYEEKLGEDARPWLRISEVFWDFITHMVFERRGVITLWWQLVNYSVGDVYPSETKAIQYLALYKEYLETNWGKGRVKSRLDAMEVNMPWMVAQELRMCFAKKNGAELVAKILEEGKRAGLLTATDNDTRASMGFDKTKDVIWGGNRLAYLVSDRFQTGFRPVSDRFQTGVRPVPCRMHSPCHSVMHSPCHHVRSAESCRMHSVTSDAQES